jgi:hypothetical protein
MEDGLMSLMLGRMALGLKIIDLTSIPQLPVFNSVNEMLESHQNRMEEFEN